MQFVYCSSVHKIGINLSTVLAFYTQYFWRKIEENLCHFFCLLLRTGKHFFFSFSIFVGAAEQEENKKKCETWKIKNNKINCLLEMGDSQLFLEFDLKFKWRIFCAVVSFTIRLRIYPQNNGNFQRISEKILREWKNFNNICLKKISLKMRVWWFLWIKMTWEFLIDFLCKFSSKQFQTVHDDNFKNIWAQKN